MNIEAQCQSPGGGTILSWRRLDVTAGRRDDPYMTPQQERWAEALMVERQHGDDAPRVIAERIGALAANGDFDGVARWRAIAERLTQLRQAPMQ
jgi:hypothetical protein